MSRWFCKFLALCAIISTGVTCSNVRNEEQCVNYYRTGDGFDINQLIGNWYAVYYWPPIQRRRDSCETIQFQKINQFELDCHKDLVFGDTLLKSSYVNNAGKQKNVYYYGSDEVKNQIRSCDKVSKYIFIDIDDGYVMGINCSAAGRGVLLARNLTSVVEVQSVVDDIEIMTGRQGSPDCPL